MWQLGWNSVSFPPQFPGQVFSTTSIWCIPVGHHFDKPTEMMLTWTNLERRYEVLVPATRWGPQSIAWNVALFQWLKMVDITIVNGGYFMVYKPTYIWGAPSCSYVCSLTSIHPIYEVMPVMLVGVPWILIRYIPLINPNVHQVKCESTCYHTSARNL